MLKPLTDGGPYIYWGDYPYFDEKDPEFLQAAQLLMATSMKNLAEMVKEPRKVILILYLKS